MGMNFRSSQVLIAGLIFYFSNRATFVLILSGSCTLTFCYFNFKILSCLYTHAPGIRESRLPETTACRRHLASGQGA